MLPHAHGPTTHAVPEAGVQLLIVRCGTVPCALPVSAIAEVMRPVEIRTIAGSPAFIAGVAMIRGLAVPVVLLAQLLDAGSAAQTTRFVTLHVSDRLVALAVDAVIGFRWLQPSDLASVPPLLSQAHPELIDGLGSLDRELVLVLRSSGLLTSTQLALLPQEARS